MLYLTNQRDRLIVLASFWLCCGISCVCWAQPPKGPPQRGSKESREFWSIVGEASKDANNNRFYFWRMVEHPSIQSEIELTAEELKGMDDLNQQHMDEVRKLRDDYIKDPDKQVCKKELTALLNKQDAAFTQKLEEVANLERLLQISIQVYGNRAATQGEIAERIGLSNEKMTEIRHLTVKIHREEFEKMGDTIRELLRSGLTSDKKVRDTFKQIDNKINETIKLKLTTQQLEALNQLKGPPFEIPADLFERRRTSRNDRHREVRNSDLDNKDSDNKDSDNKDGDNKDGDNKDGDNKDGDNKDGCATSCRIYVYHHHHS